jgi:hypothetical protein
LIKWSAKNAKDAKNKFVKMIITNSNINSIRIEDITMPSLRALRFSRTKISMSEVMNEAFVTIMLDGQEHKANG